MSRTSTRAWPALVYAAASAVVGLLWWFTAIDDAEWALWRRYEGVTAMMNVAVSVGVCSIAYLLCARNDLVPRAGRLVFIIGGSLLAIGLLEVPALLGLLDYGMLLGTSDNDTWLQLAMGVNRADRELLHIHQGHTRYRGVVHGNLKRLGIPAASYAVDVAYDSNGFRNDRDFTRADIVAIGDSFVEGAEVQRPQTMVAQLGRELTADVVNLGQSNYGPQQELIVLKRYAVPLQPKAVVWFLFGGNDLDDVISYEERRRHYDQFLAPPSLGARSFTRNALRAAAALTTPPRRVPSPEGRLHAAMFTRRNGTKESLYLDVEEGPWAPRQWEATAAILSDASDLTRRHGADFLVVFIPRKLRVYRGFLRAEPGTYARTWKDNNLPDVLNAWCRDNGVDFLDSTVALRAAVASGESVYLPDDVHWNVAGHRVVAGAVAERIRQMGSLQAHKPDQTE